MTRAYLRFFLLTLLSASLLVFTGCASSPKDVSSEPRIKELALVGRCFRLKSDAALVQVGRPYPHLGIESRFVTSMRDEKEQIGTVKAGTRFRVLRVERAPTYFDGMFEILSDLAIAKIETGQYTGKEVDLWWPAVGLLPKAGETKEPYEDCPARNGVPK